MQNAVFIEREKGYNEEVNETGFGGDGMKRRMAEAVLRGRNWILADLLVLAVLSAGLIGRTRINYDLTRYLQADTMTRRALGVMEAEFGGGEQLRVMFRDMDEAGLNAAVERLRLMDEVRLALPDGADREAEDGHRYRLVTLTLNPCDASALVERLRALFPEAAVGGAAAGQLDVQRNVAREIPEAMAIAVAVVLLVLLLTSRAWLEPLIILFVLAVSIVINMGTNFLFPDVSFITFAVSAILQLALSIDYAIMLLHTWRDRVDAGQDAERAMAEALAECFMRIASSGFTTVAGLLSLLFMSFTIGFDIGLVLSKGIVISMLCVFLLMPPVTLLLREPLRRTQHRPLRLGGAHLADAVWRLRWPLAAVLTAVVLCGAVLQSGNAYSFSDPGSGGDGQNQGISRVYGRSEPLAILVPGGTADEDYDRQRALAERLGAIRVDGQPFVSGVTAMVTTGEAALRYMTPADVAEMSGMSEPAVNLFFLMNGFGGNVRADRLLEAAGSLGGLNPQIGELQSALAMARDAFERPNWSRMLVTLSVPSTDPRVRGGMRQVLDACAAVYGDGCLVTGVPMSICDIGSAFESDLKLVNLITAAAILLIVMCSFRAAALPCLLVLVIEGAIWITMGISRLRGEPIFFMSYLICVAMQMGATIDYAILLSDQYRSLRRAAVPVREALRGAMERALPTILTSGLILITAGYIIGRRCTVYYISSIGLLLSRGAAISVCLVLTLLPALLTVADRVVTGRRRRDS